MTKRIAIAGFQHETNTFAPILTGYEDFEHGGAWPPLTQSDSLIEVFRKLNIPIGGFIESAVATNWDLVPVLWAGAEPGSFVNRQAFDKISSMVIDGICKGGALDGIYLDLHGAMVVDGYEDGEGELLSRIRDAVPNGAEIPIAVSLDLHGNLTPEFFDLASSVAIYRTYPHIDMAATGARAHALLAAEFEQGKPFARAFRQLDYLIPLPSQSTMSDPARLIYQSIEHIDEVNIESADVALGFPPADIHHSGASVVVYGSDEDTVASVADRIISEINAREQEFLDPMVDADTAVAQARSAAAAANRPVVIADPQDNPGAGGTGDTTGLLEALVRGGAKDAYLGMLWDPAAAAKAHELGVGATFSTELGGRYPAGGCGPFAATVEVESLGNGAFEFTGPMFGGSHATLGPMALLRILDDGSDVHVIVNTNRTQNADQAIYRHLGVEPTDHAILVVKSAVHFLADYDPIAEVVIFAESPGAHPCRLGHVQYKNLRPGIRLGPNGRTFGGA